MSKNKINHPVALDETYFELWPGFSGPRELGELKLLEWPVEHPDTHCRKGEYIPDDDGVCSSCGWIPADKVHCEGCGKTVRLLSEKSLLRRMISESPYSPPEVAYAIYLGYVAKFGDQLNSTPNLKAAVKWFEDMDAEEQDALMQDHLACESIVISMEMPLEINLEEVFSMFGESIFSTFDNEQLEGMLDIDDLPEDLAGVIRQILEDRQKGE